MKDATALAQRRHDSLDWLLNRVRQGDREAFDELIQRFEKNVLKTALFLTRNLDDAQDVAQEVYVTLVQRADTLAGMANIEGWVYRVTVNAARDLLRKRRMWAPLRASLSWIRPTDPAARREVEGRLVRALQMLSFNERAAFVFKELHEMETAEVADVLGCRQTTVRGYLHAARKKLRRRFRDFREEK